MSYPAQDPSQPQYAAPQYGAPMATGVIGPGEPYDGAATPEDLSRPLYGASLGQAAKRFFKNYANFKGRASRSEYWWAQLFIFLLQIIPLILYITGAVMSATSAASDMSIDEYGNITSTGSGPSGGALAVLLIGVGLLIIISLAVLIPSIAIAWRRLHDANFAGPFWFLSLTSVGGIIVLIFTLLPPKPEGRRFDAR